MQKKNSYEQQAPFIEIFVNILALIKTLYQCVRKNIAINSAVITQVPILISLISPQKALITTYESRPKAIPYDMLYVNGIIAMVRKAGTETETFFQSISLTLPIIRTPT